MKRILSNKLFSAGYLVGSLGMSLTALSAFAADPSLNHSLKLFKSSFKAQSQENILVSPTSLKSAMGMVAAGATEKEQAQIMKGLGLEGMSFKEFLGESQSFANRAFESPSGFRLVTANAMYLRDDADQKFETTIGDYFRGNVSKVDFTKQETANQINFWVSEKTKFNDAQEGAIKHIVDANEINELYFLAVNATYLNAGWTVHFDSPPEWVRKEKYRFRAPKFYDENDNVVMDADGKNHYVVDFMTSNPSMKIAQVDYPKFEAFEVPYQLDRDGTPLGSMIIVHPKAQNAEEAREAYWSGKEVALKHYKLAEVVEELSPAIWEKMIADFKDQRSSDKIWPILLKLPKFSVDYELTNDLAKSMLVSWGLGPVMGTIDLSRMVSDPSRKDDWAVNRIKLVKQKTTISVAEEGTIAAAVTAIGGFPESCPPPTKMLDSPFAYFIRDGKTGEVVFAGTFVNPKKTKEVKKLNLAI